MKKINNKGFSRTELTTVLVMLLVLIAALLYHFIVNEKMGRYSSFKKLAENFVDRASVYKDKVYTEIDTYYLYDMINEKFTPELENPFSESVYCNRYESYVKIREDDKLVHLQCGNHLITGIYQQRYTIYETTEWSEEVGTGLIDSKIFYQYKKNGELMTEEFVTEQEVLEMYNEESDILALSIDDIRMNEEIELIEKVYYRTRKSLRENA